MSSWDNIAETAAQIERDRHEWLAEQAKLLGEPNLLDEIARGTRVALFVSFGTLAATVAILALTIVLVLR
jgi:hypothetical protein